MVLTVLTKVLLTLLHIAVTEPALQACRSKSRVALGCVVGGGERRGSV